MAKKKLKRKPKKLLIALIVIIIIIIGSIICYFTIFNKKSVKENKVVSKIPGYGYTLKSNKSSAYKKLFQELKDVLTAKKVDEKKYAKTITKMFIVDFYSLSDHTAKTDVGGTDFVYSTVLDNFLLNAEDTIYKYVESDIYKQRNQQLPIVDVVSIDSVKSLEYTYGDKTDDNAYEVRAHWTYKDSKIADGYQTEAKFIYIHDGKKLNLVEISDTDSESSVEEDDE